MSQLCVPFFLRLAMFAYSNLANVRNTGCGNFTVNLTLRCNRAIVYKRMSAANVKVVIGILPTCEIPLETSRCLYQLPVGRDMLSAYVANLQATFTSPLFCGYISCLMKTQVTFLNSRLSLHVSKTTHQEKLQRISTKFSVTKNGSITCFFS